MLPFSRLPFQSDPINNLRLLFNGTIFVWWIMVGLVFLYAFFVLSAWFGYIPLNFDSKTMIDVFNKLKYILLSVSLLFYLIIRLIKSFIAWLYHKRYLYSVIILFFVSLIIFALCEAVSIYGLVIFLFSKNPADFFLFMAISLFYFYSFFPKYEDWERLLNQEFETTSSHL